MDWLLLIPLVLAYLLRGAKTGFTFLPVFIGVGSLFIFCLFQRKWKPIPVSLLLAFGGFLFWSWLGLLSGAPLDSFLFMFARILMYMLMSLLILQFGTLSFEEKFKYALLGLGLIEALLINMSRVQGGYPQFSGFLKNPLHSGLLLPIAFAVLIEKLNEERWRLLRWLGVLLGGLMVVALALTRSRGGLISLVVILIFLYPRRLL